MAAVRPFLRHDCPELLTVCCMNTSACVVRCLSSHIYCDRRNRLKPRVNCIQQLLCNYGTQHCALTMYSCDLYDSHKKKNTGYLLVQH